MSFPDSMAQGFDPYHKWLGIPPHEQPANLYRLLGVSLFESDLDVISSAADQRMAHLRSFQTGANVALTQQLLTEVSRARVRLLNPAQKAAYDEELRDSIASANGAVPPARLAVSPTPAPPPIISPRAPNAVGLRQVMIPAARVTSRDRYKFENARPIPVGTAVSVTFSSPQSAPLPAGSVSTASVAHRRPKKRRRRNPIYGVVTGGVLGLVMGYSFLINIKPDADFFDIFPDHDKPPSLEDPPPKGTLTPRKENGEKESTPKRVKLKARRDIRNSPETAGAIAADRPDAKERAATNAPL